MSDTLFVKGLVLHAHHGVHAHEAKIGQAFILDVEMAVDLSEAARTDRLSTTCSYDEFVETIRKGFLAKRFRLVEAAGGAVADALFAKFPQVRSVTITVRKPHAPVSAVFDHVGVTLSRSR